MEAPLSKLLEYTTTFGNISLVGEGQQVPWCHEEGTKLPYLFKTSSMFDRYVDWPRKFDSWVCQACRNQVNVLNRDFPPYYDSLTAKEQQHVFPNRVTRTDYVAYPEFIRVYVGNLSINKIATLLHEGANIVYNCSFWDKLGVGHSSHPSKQAQVPTTVGQVAFTSFKPVYTRANIDSDAVDTASSGVEGFGHLTNEDLDTAVAQVVRDAGRLLDQQVASELATTDSTKTVLGALWDMSVVVLGIVAMACWRKDTEKWIGHKLGITFKLTSSKVGATKAGRKALYLAKVVYCCIIVPAGLVLAPAVTAKSDVSARDQNAAGEVGWLAAPVANSIPSGRDGFQPSYVLVAAVTVRTTADYNGVAQVLLWINLAVAIAGTLCIWFVSSADMPSTRRTAAALPQAAQPPTAQ